MTKIKKTLLLMAAIALIAAQMLACKSDKNPVKNDAPDTVNVFEQNARIGRAINFGNALEAPNEGDWGVTLQEEYFKAIQQAGFQAVRIPIRWSAHAQAEAPYTIDSEFFNRVNWAIGRARANQLAVIINIHHYEEIFSQPQQQKTRFLSLWKQIATRYKDYPDDLLFEVLNEPHDQLDESLWNSFLAEAIDTIRVTNPRRTLIIGTAGWGGISALHQLQLPENDHNIILTIHYYNPFEFTHQGAEWADNSSQWLGTRWEGTFEQKQAVQNEFAQIQAWADSEHVPVFLGEFGAYHKAPLADRARWTSFVAREAERRGFSWAYWEFCSGFGAYDAGSSSWNTELLQALIPPE